MAVWADKDCIRTVRPGEAELLLCTDPRTKRAAHAQPLQPWKTVPAYALCAMSCHHEAAA